MIKAVILAGGLGLRLRAVVADRPKPLATINGEPFLELQLRWLRRAGVRAAVLCVGHRAEQIVAALGDGERLGLQLEYAVEQEPLGTAGALRHAAAALAGERRWLLLNGDTFAEVDLAALVAHHDAAAARGQGGPRGPRGPLGTICTFLAEDAADKGLVEVTADGALLGFAEKAQPGPGRVNAGVYVLDARVLALIPAGRSVSLEREVIPAALRAGERLLAFPVHGRMIDIGTPADYARAQALLADLQDDATGAGPAPGTRP